MAQLFANNAAGKLLSGISDTDTTLTLQTSQGALFPSPSGGDFFLVTLFEAGETNHEIVRCTGRSGDALTVTRAQEGTTARTFATGTSVELRVTAATMKQATNYANLVAQEADSTVTGGNARGTGAVDLQTTRGSASQVASGNHAAILGGESNTASGHNSTVCGGTGNTASGGSSAVLFGSYNTADGSYSAAAGVFATTNGVSCKVTFGSLSDTYGTSQTGSLALSRTTADATPVVLRSNISAVSATNQLAVPPGGAQTFSGLVVARQQAAGGTQTAAWRVEGVIRRETTAASTVLVASTVTAISNAPGWVLALSADTTYGALAVTFTGAAATNVRVVASLRTAETIYT